MKKQLDSELLRVKSALEYCLRTLKHHHMSKPGISATVAETELRMKDIPKPMWYPLFEHMCKERGLALIDSKLEEIAIAADKSRMEANGGGVTYILVNALRHLDDEQMLELL